MASKDKNQSVEHGSSAWAEFARRFKQNPVIFVGTLVILLITIVAFVFVPAFSPSGSASAKLNFGSYDGIPIDFMQGNYFAEQRDYYNQQYRSSSTNQNIQTVAFQIWRAAFESTVIRTAAIEEAKAVGFKTPETLVDKKMAEYPAFLEDGTFSAAKFRAMSDSDRMNLRSKMKEDIAASRYLEDLSSLRISSKETEFIKKMASPERSFEFIAVPVLSYPEAEIASFVETNQDLFKSIKLSKITLSSSEADAKKVLASLKNGELSFEDAARTHSKDELADKGGEMGAKEAWQLKTEIPDEAARTAVLALSAGSLSEVTKVPAGWAIFRCDEAAVSPKAKDPATLASAKEYIVRFERGRMEDWAVAKANTIEADAKESSLDDAAAKAGLTKKSVGPVPLNYGDIEFFGSLSSQKLDELQGASTNEAFLKAAFSAKPGAFTDPVVVGDNVLVLRVVEERSADDSSTAMLDFWYPYQVSQYDQQLIRDTVMNSPKLKDNFYAVFIKNFLAQ